MLLFPTPIPPPVPLAPPPVPVPVPPIVLGDADAVEDVGVAEGTSEEDEDRPTLLLDDMWGLNTS